LPTTYYLTVAPTHIRTHSETVRRGLHPAERCECLQPRQPLEGIANTKAACSSKARKPIRRSWKGIPPYGQKIIRNKRLQVYYLDTVKIAKEIATAPDLQQRMQGVVLVGIFIRVTPFAAKVGMGDDQVLGSVEKYIRKYFGKRGEHVVLENLKCVREGL